LVPFDAKQHTQTPLVDCIDLACIRLRYRPTLYKESKKSTCQFFVTASP